MQSWLPSAIAPDPASQQRILDLEAQIAKSRYYPFWFHAYSTYLPIPTQSNSQSLHFHTEFSVGNPWLESNPISTLTETAYKKWLKDLQLPQPKLDVLDRNIAKALSWWNDQPDSAGDTIVGMGMNPTKLKANTSYDLLIRVMTVALTCPE